MAVRQACRWIPDKVKNSLYKKTIVKVAGRFNPRLIRRSNIPSIIGLELPDPEEQGFQWLNVTEFINGDTDLEDCWLRRFTFREIHEGFVADRNPQDDDKDSLTEEVVDTLRGGNGVVVTGPSGAGKSTLARKVATRWKMGDSNGREPIGEVLYRDHGDATPITDVSDLKELLEFHSEYGDSPILVTCLDAARLASLPVLIMIYQFRNNPNVSFLLEANENEWQNSIQRMWQAKPEETKIETFDPDSVRGEQIMTQRNQMREVLLGDLNKRGIRNAKEKFEEITGKRMFIGENKIYRDLNGRGTYNYMIELIFYMLLNYKKIDYDSDSPIKGHVRQEYSNTMNKSESARDIVLAINILNAAGFHPIKKKRLEIFTDDGSGEAVASNAISRLEGETLFETDENGSYRCVHKQWSVIFLSEFKRREYNAPSVFQSCVNELAKSASEPLQLFKDVFDIGIQRPDLHELFGCSENSQISPESKESLLEMAILRGKINHEVGNYDGAIKEYNFVLNHSDDQNQARCLLGLARVHLDSGDLDNAKKKLEMYQSYEKNNGKKENEIAALTNMGEIYRKKRTASPGRE
jgi:tetratricopeptide (TPR) repeat protein